MWTLTTSPGILEGGAYLCNYCYIGTSLTLRPDPGLASGTLDGVRQTENVFPGISVGSTNAAHVVQGGA